MKRFYIRLEDQIDGCLFGLKLAKDLGDEEGVRAMKEELIRLVELRDLVEKNIDILEEDKAIMKEWE